MDSVGPLVPGGLAAADVVVESTAPEAEALAALLASEGARVRLAGAGELDRNPVADAAFLDAWTPEIAPRVATLRAAGCFVTCLADLLLARAGDRTLAVTGTAGKTTTTSLVAQLLHAAGVIVHVPAPGLSGNLWPDETSVRALQEPGLNVVELTSSHLAFCHGSPRIAVVTSLWPDHVELHGSFQAYARAKEAIVREQRSDGWLVVPADGTSERFVRSSRARVARFSVAGAVAEGAFVRHGEVVVRWDGREARVAAVDSLPVRGRCVANALAACAAALAADAQPETLEAGLRSAVLPPHRFVEVARTAGVPVYDDSMAGTPAKAAAALDLFPDRSIVLVAGGETVGAGGPVHATAAERRLLEEACALGSAKAKATFVFGPAAPILTELLPTAEVATDLKDAVERGMAAAPGSAAVLIAPMFPVETRERERIRGIAARSAG